MKAAALLLTMACAAPAFAQITRGAISGTVRDTSGAVVSGVGVTVTRVDTNVARRSLSDALGFYRVATRPRSATTTSRWPTPSATAAPPATASAALPLGTPTSAS